jgi:hypothetical protein
LFGEYKFKRDAGNLDDLLIDPSAIIANDKVPLMSYVARQGARKFRQLQKTTDTKCEGAAIGTCLEATRTVSLAELSAKFPWAAANIEHVSFSPLFFPVFSLLFSSVFFLLSLL